MSNRMSPDQARRSVGPDLGPICLQGSQHTSLNRQRIRRRCCKCRMLINHMAKSNQASQEHQVVNHVQKQLKELSRISEKHYPHFS